MSTPINDGGPAFPHDVVLKDAGNYRGTERCAGMTLRDYFAGQVIERISGKYIGTAEMMDQASREAYMLADSMIKAREGNQ
jgi:hypothetical protein